MRLSKVDHGHTLGKRVFFGMMKFVTRQEPYDIMKMLAYRPQFFGARLSKLTQAVMRGPSEWSVADRELMASFTSLHNQCPF